MFEKGSKGSYIESEIRKDGYIGYSSNIRCYISKIKKLKEGHLE